MTRIETEDTFPLPFITITGLVQDASTSDFTFDINAAQYTQFFGHKRTFPAHLIFPDSPRYKNKKPMPGNNLFVSMSGFLSRVVVKEHDPSQHNPTHKVHHFVIDIDTIVFLGRIPLTPASPTKPGIYCVHLFLLYV